LRVDFLSAGILQNFKPRPEHLQLLQDPKWGNFFNRGFHCNRGGGTVPLAMLDVFLQAKIALTFVRPEALAKAAAWLIGTEFPGWWWNCGHCALRKRASAVTDQRCPSARTNSTATKLTITTRRIVTLFALENPTRINAGLAIFVVANVIRLLF
jgi:hypothetical protein